MTTRTADMPRLSISPAPARSTSAVEEIMDLVSDANTHVARLSAALMREPSLMQNVLRKANTPVFGFKHRVKSVDLAIVLLGFDVLKKTVAGVLIHGAMRKMVDVLFRYDEYWNHSVACAVIARYLAERSGKCDPNDTFVAGLFHDIGTLVTPPHRTDLPGAPQTAGIDEHGAAGARILERWNLPASVIEAVRHHHAPERATADPVLAAAVHVADVLCHTTAIARFAPEDIPVWSPAALEVLGLSEPDLQVDQLIAYGGSINVPMGSMGAFDKMVLELRGHLVDILANLPEQQKIVLALCYSEGLSASEVGKLMNIDQRTVTMLLGESFRQLQELMLTRV